MMARPCVVFMGSGPVAAESLRRLTETCDIEAVITKPTTEREMRAASNCERVLCVRNKQELDQLVAAEKFSSTTAVLIDFGIIVSQTVIDSFTRGIINSHFSVLPELRGADPISFAILTGAQRTGVSLMLIVEAMDEGPLLAVGEYPLNGTETTPQLTEALVGLSDTLLKQHLPDYVAHGQPQPKQQSVICKDAGRPFEPTYTRKLSKQDGIVDWTKSAETLEREVRAYSGWPKSRTTLGSVDVALTKTHVTLLSGMNAPTSPGTMFIDIPTGCLAVACGDGHYLCIEGLVPAGKREMAIADFLRGYRQKLVA